MGAAAAAYGGIDVEEGGGGRLVQAHVLRQLLTLLLIVASKLRFAQARRALHGTVQSWGAVRAARL